MNSPYAPTQNCKGLYNEAGRENSEADIIFRLAKESEQLMTNLGLK